MYPKNRLEALTDGIFAMAMTLLTLNLVAGPLARTYGRFVRCDQAT